MRLQHSVFVRKSLAIANRIPRAIRRIRSGENAFATRPAVFANSFPKSGTHLLLQIVEALPGITNYGTFIASQPTVPYIERSVDQQVRMIRAVAPGEVAAAHMFHDAAFEAEIERRGAHFFIYRDLRDVAVSEAFYLTYMNRFHRMHRYFRNHLRTMDERLMVAIRGVVGGVWRHEYPDIATRFARYRAWLRSSHVHAVRYEDLVGAHRERALAEIVTHYTKRAGTNADEDALVHHVSANIAAERSHTFREGGSGGWRAHFKPEHREEMQRTAGRLLLELGYEADMAWAS